MKKAYIQLSIIRTILTFIAFLLVGRMSLFSQNCLQGYIHGIFSVSDSTKVLFSQGNLQYIGSAETPYWKFADHQWDYLGTTTGQNSDSQTVDRDLFGWGTSGYNHGAICYQPWSTSQTYSDYYAYGSETTNLFDQSGQADWGYNAISNGGNTENSGWRTLTSEEWDYLFNTRSTASGLRYVRAQVNGIYGVILLPDDWSTSYYTLFNTNGGYYYSSNITAVQWNTLEQHGAVFLPAAGERNGISVNYVGSYGLYWSASYDDYTLYGSYSYAGCLFFYSSSVSAHSRDTRKFGHSVRLVCSAQGYSVSINASSFPTEGGTVSGAGIYEAGAECTLTATASAGYHFAYWTQNGRVVSSDASYTFMVDFNRDLVANFTKDGSTGSLNGLFSTGENSSVLFSQGNLQYKASTDTWRFAENQWDYVGVDNGNASSTYSSLIDLFGWGTSGYNHGAICYQPWSTSQTYSDYYAYGSDTTNLFDQTAQADWGYNAIINGGNTENSGWRTLRDEEWSYLFNTRSTASGIRFAKAQVNGINGVILLPDDWNCDFYSLNNTNIFDASFLSNDISVSLWNTLAQHGAVFLPAAGCRYGTSVSDVGSYGYYWSASYDYSSSAWYVGFYDSGLYTDGEYYRYYGRSVRLVRFAQGYSVIINASPYPADGGIVSGAGAYEVGAECTLTAVPSAGYHFAYWTQNGRVVSSDASYTFTVGSNRDLVANFALDNTTGCLNGLFTTGENSSVLFSQGNLQYQASTNTWRFAENQWDYVGSDNGNISETYSGLIDLFGWGTSGFNHGATCYQPWSTSDNYYYYYAYGNSNSNLNDQSGQADWGYNAISNGGNMENSGWRTLTHEEWDYVFNTRSTASGIRYANACVDGVNGVILLPDDWSADYYILNNTNGYDASFNSNTITAIQWSTLEQHGAVFLPAAGNRYRSSVSNVGSDGYYWSASYYNSDNAWSVCFGDSYLSTGSTDRRYYGRSVRLVRSVQGYSFVIDATPSPAEGGAVSGAGTYEAGAECTLKATASAGYHFAYWTQNGRVVSLNAKYTFTVGNNRNLVANFAPDNTTGCLNGVFSTGENTSVMFSQGNLQYRASTNTWHFAENQWDYVGSDNGNISETYGGLIDLFVWGTSGYNHNNSWASTYQPWNVWDNCYAYGSRDYNLYDQTGQADWGYNAISNGGNTENSGWRTMTYEEWSYLLNTRNTESGIRYALAQVNGINGAILLPDDWSTSYYALNNTDNNNASFSSNIITATQWITLEQHGAVFLPAAGSRNGTSVNDVGSYGHYWSASHYFSNYVRSVRFSDSWLDVSYSYTYLGESVRLVRSHDCSVNVAPNPTEGGVASGSGTYEAGAECTLTATASAGYHFAYWTQNGRVVSSDASYTFTVANNRDLVANFAPDSSTGFLTGLFTTGENSSVLFSQGNLQYRASTNTWRFAENQWDYVGSDNSNASSTYSGLIDLFGWGTSGYNHGAKCYQPWSTSQAYNDYYAYGSDTTNLFDQSGQADWGYNAISNGGNTENSGWRTMTYEEWSYLLNTRNTESGIRYAKAQVNGVIGVILLPDDWSADYYYLSGANNDMASFSSNVITETPWTVLEQYGAVFLPVAGYRIGTSVYFDTGMYWSSSGCGDASLCTGLYDSDISSSYCPSRSRGASVRLVRDFQVYSLTASVNPSEGGTISFNNSKYDFEAGVIPEELNNTVSSYPWTVLSTNPNSGSFCMASSNNAVGNSESYVDAVVEFVEDGSVDFYSRISSESDYDWGRFYIDGAEMLSESGTENTWTARHYDVSAGTHTFRWYYSKDGSYNEGEDCYYIDDITFTGISSESISLDVLPGETYKLIAIPNEGYAFVNWTENGEVVSTDATYTFTVTGDRNLVANFQYNVTEGYVNGGLFSVNDGQQVFFSQGNLQYQAATNTWRFAENQYDYVGSDNANISQTNSGWIDLFGWGTSGYDHGANCYQPWSTSTSYSDYYAYGSATSNLFDQSGQADWGYNAILNGGNHENSGWRTLTYEEWSYLFNTRTTESGILFAKAKVNNVNGVILLPDNWDASYYTLNNTNTSTAYFSANVITLSEWNTLERYGAVFLPAAGSRNETFVGGVGYGGYYWSASYDDSYYTWCVRFDDSNLYTGSSLIRYYAQSVRLVRIAQGYSFDINAVPNPAEGGSVIGGGAYEAGAECSLTATASDGYTFVYWSENGEVVSMDAIYTFTVSGDRNLVANFTENSGSGMLNGVFSVSENDPVYFSQGNLQYQASTNTWQFATNQWDFVGGFNGNISQNYSGWIDLFGWGTSGYNHGATCYQPWSTSTSTIHYLAYGSYSNNLYDQTGQADWGYNAIINGGNQENSGWRTLTHEEWSYLFETRTTTSGIRYAKASVNNINGVILLPDDWSADYYSLNSTNTSNASYSSNVITADQWVALEQHGAVFLPAAGSRDGTSVYLAGTFGYYWSASCAGTSYAWNESFYDSSLNAGNDGVRSFGQSVRLVRVAQGYSVVHATANPAEGGMVSGSGACQENTECTLTATANEGYVFVNWTENGEVVSTDANYSFIVTGSRTLVANFRRSDVSIDDGALTGHFSVADNRVVSFSQGNLQYIGSASTPYWKFAEHQWDYLGSNDQGSDLQTANRDLFGWGTSGYDHGATCYQPWSTSQTNTDYSAYGSDSYNLFDQTGQADWGYNAISNGGNQENSGWRTLTKDEWNYLFNTRSTLSGIRYAKARVNAINGVILLPDDWSVDYYSLNSTNSVIAYFSSNSLTASQWTILEQHGAVFLPLAGYRVGTSMNKVGSYGDYWSATNGNGVEAASAIQFNSSSLGVQENYYRKCGFSVRLVRRSQGYSFIDAMPNPAEGGSVSGIGDYAMDTECTLTATANEGYTFVDWTENGVVVSTEAEYTFTVTQDRNLVANFEQSSGEIEQTFDLSAGWNWMSSYLECTPELFNALKDGIAANNSTAMIKDMSSSTMLNYGMWSASDLAFVNEKMYMTSLQNATEVTLTAAAADPAEHPITIRPGWNWIGFVSADAMTITEALSSLAPTNGDLLKDMASASSYSASGWAGNLVTLEPGNGYMYYNTGAQKTLTYPASAKGVVHNLPRERYWNTNVHEHATNLVMMATLDEGQFVMGDGNYEIGAFVDGECRGSARLQKAGNGYVAFLVIHGEAQEVVSFKLYDVTNAVEAGVADEQISYVANAITGSVEEPVVLHFRGLTDVDENREVVRLYPNPANKEEHIRMELPSSMETTGARVEVYNALGALVTTSTVNGRNVELEGLKVAGLYTVKVTDHNGNACYGKLVVR